MKEDYWKPLINTANEKKHNNQAESTKLVFEKWKEEQKGKGIENFKIRKKASPIIRL